eukprot:1346712-Prymnesium_polylepis.1
MVCSMGRRADGAAYPRSTDAWSLTDVWPCSRLTEKVTAEASVAVCASLQEANVWHQPLENVV